MHLPNIQFAYEHIELEHVGSTNVYAEELMNTQRPSQGTLVSARSQTEGRGQDRNTWVSEPYKNLTVTLILYPNFLHPANQFLLTQVASLAVCRTVNAVFGKPVAEIKWPNDIFVHNRKIAGLLIKCSVSANEITGAIVGLGLNINQTEFGELAETATSLKLLTGRDHRVRKIMTIWHKNFREIYKSLAIGLEEEISKQYLARLKGLNQWNRFTILGRETEAQITGVDEYGRLQLVDSAGSTHSCAMKEVVFHLP